MSPEAITRVLREGLLLVLLLSAGPMLASMLIGLVVSILCHCNTYTETHHQHQGKGFSRHFNSCFWRGFRWFHVSLPTSQISRNGIDARN